MPAPHWSGRSSINVDYTARTARSKACGTIENIDETLMSGPFLCFSALLFCSILASAQLTAQSRISTDVSRQIDSALYILGMHQRDLSMPYDLLDRDKHRTSTIDDLFRSPYSAIERSERIADKCLSGSTSLLSLQEMLHSALQLGTFQRVFLDNMPESETVLSKLGISKGSINNLKR